MKRWGIILTALAFAGCVHYQPRPLDPAKKAEEFESRRLGDEGLRAFLEKQLGHSLTNWPPEHWNLEQLTLAAFYYQPSLDVARAQWPVATAGKTTAAERPNPTLSVSPTYNTTTTIPSPWILTPSLDIPIETAGKRGYRIAQAQQLSKAARLNIASLAWQVCVTSAPGFGDDVSPQRRCLFGGCCGNGLAASGVVVTAAAAEHYQQDHDE